LANLNGSRILLGVDDEKNIVGITRANLSEWVADTVLGRYVHPVILPYYEATEDYVKVVVGKTSGKSQRCRENVKNVGREIDKRRETVKTSGKILEACRERNTITIPELAAWIGISERSIERNIQKLQQNGLLKRAGGRKGGHWEVVGFGANSSET
jgi:predicted HTH transcriptional regulator